MPRNISCSITTEQVRTRIKTVTRRTGWLNLKPGEILNACVKCMGLRPGEKIERICQIRVVSVRREPLRRMMDDVRYGFTETTLEGFPEGHIYHFPPHFVDMFCRTHRGVTPDSEITRIEFEYMKGAG